MSSVCFFPGVGMVKVEVADAIDELRKRDYTYVTEETFYNLLPVIGCTFKTRSTFISEDKVLVEIIGTW